MKVQGIARTTSFWLFIFLLSLPPAVQPQTAEEYLKYFRRVLENPGRYDATAVLREFDRCELSFGNAPQLGEVLALRARFLSAQGRCGEALVSAAKAVVVFRTPGTSGALARLRKACLSRLPNRTRSKLAALFRLRTGGLAQPTRARRFVLALLRANLIELQTAVRREVEWYLTWFPQPAGADSVRAAFGDYLLEAGRPRDALAEYQTALEMFEGSLLVPELAVKAFRVAKNLGLPEEAQEVVKLAESSLSVPYFSDTTLVKILVALSRLYLETGGVGRRELKVFSRALDEYRDFSFPADLLWEYGLLFEARGDTERAILCYRLLTVRYPSDERSAEARARLRRLELDYWKRQGEELKPFATLDTTTERFRSPLTPIEIASIKRALLERINEDRRRRGLQPVRFDSLASLVADRHCAEALVNNYSGHFDLNGFKPYHRYAFAGGYHAITENFSSGMWTAFRANAQRVLEMVLKAHERMMAERAPNDGHRQNILAPQHNYCGIGLAVGPRGYRMAQEFLDVYVRFDHIPRIVFSTREAKTETLWVSGHTVNGARLVNATLHFEPWPAPMDPAEITRRRSYALPSFYTSLQRLVEQTVQDGRTAAVIHWYWAPWSDFKFPFTEDGVHFNLPVVFHKGGPGIYTLAIWVRKPGISGHFPATYLCFFVR